MKEIIEAKVLTIQDEIYHIKTFSLSLCDAFSLFSEIVLFAFGINAIYWSGKQTKNICKQCLVENMSGQEGSLFKRIRYLNPLFTVHGRVLANEGSYFEQN